MQVGADAGGGCGGGSGNGAAAAGPAEASSAAAAAGAGLATDLAIFQSSLTAGQTAEGRRVVEALERLKLPDESAMGPRELACWHENKKTIVNSLRTLSSQIYSATARVVVCHLPGLEPRSSRPQAGLALTRLSLALHSTS